MHVGDAQASKRSAAQGNEEVEGTSVAEFAERPCYLVSLFFGASQFGQQFVYRLKL